MDAITMLKDDHQTVEQLFKRFEKAGDRAFAEKRKLADRIIEALSKHAAIEEQVFYPVARATVPDAEKVALESLEEHHIVKWVLAELDRMDATDERFDAKMTVLIENVRHHVEEEETEFFPKVRAELDRNALAEVGQAMAAAKEIAPRHPHPRAPDTPPENLTSAGAGMVDRIGDTVSGVAQGSVTAVQDLIALILGRRKRSAAPTGSKVARDTARDVREGASRLTDDAVAAAVRAKQTVSTAAVGAKKTANAAADATKATARTASKGTKRTARATKRSSSKRTTPTAKRTSAPRKARAGAKKAASSTARAAKKAAATAA